MSTEKETTPGNLVRGADGSLYLIPHAARKLTPGTVVRTADKQLYFIPDEALEHFRVTSTADNAVLGVFYTPQDADASATEELSEAVDAKHVVAPIENVIIK